MPVDILGQVYKCLKKNKYMPNMSQNCKIQITRRQLIITRNVKTDTVFMNACSSDLKKNECFQKVRFYDKLYNNSEFFMANVLICLENAYRNGTNVTKECESEIFDRRTMLMHDYRLSPNIVEFCTDEIIELCNNGIERNGKTLQCLLKNSRITAIKDEYFDPDCLEEVSFLALK